MPTLPSSHNPAPRQPHQARQAAESFGTDPERYDRARPRYPQALIDRIAAAIPGRDVLDVGIGTGISASPFQAAGYRVLGVEPDPRMAASAREKGLTVEEASFEDWDPAGRMFDAITAGMTWHWIDPQAGAAKAAQVLRPHGLLALFWNVHQPPPELAQAFAEIYQRVLPDTPFAGAPRDPVAGYSRLLDTVAAGIKATGAFIDIERLRFDWERRYTTEEWVDQVPTFGGHSTFPPEKLDALLSGMSAAIKSNGDSFKMTYAALTLIARRSADA